MKAPAANGSVLAALVRNRGLLGVLVARDLKARYRGTFLGYLWSLLNPLLLLAVYTVVFTWVIPARVASDVPFPLFLFAGLLPWAFLSGTLLDAAVVLGDNGPLLRKVVCPPEVFPAVTILSHLIHHLLALPILLLAIGAAAWSGAVRLPWTVVLMPVVLAIWLLAVGGLALAVAALAVHFKDLKDLLHNVLNIAFFATPIIYPLEMIRPTALRRAIQVNPATPLVQLYRDVVLLGRLPSLTAWASALGVAAVFWIVGSWIFSRLRETIAETV